METFNCKHLRWGKMPLRQDDQELYFHLGNLLLFMYHLVLLALSGDTQWETVWGVNSLYGWWFSCFHQSLTRLGKWLWAITETMVDDTVIIYAICSINKTSLPLKCFQHYILLASILFFCPCSSRYCWWLEEPFHSKTEFKVWGNI